VPVFSIAFLVVSLLDLTFCRSCLLSCHVNNSFSSALNGQFFGSFPTKGCERIHAVGANPANMPSPPYKNGTGLFADGRVCSVIKLAARNVVMRIDLNKDMPLG